MSIRAWVRLVVLALPDPIREVWVQTVGGSTEAGRTEFQAGSADDAAALPPDSHVCAPAEGAVSGC